MGHRMIALITNNRRTQSAELHIQWHIVLEMCHSTMADLIQLISKLGPVAPVFCLPSSFQSVNILVFFFNLRIFLFCFVILLAYFSKGEQHTPSDFLSILDIFCFLRFSISYLFCTYIFLENNNFFTFSY